MASFRGFLQKHRLGVPDRVGQLRDRVNGRLGLPDRVNPPWVGRSHASNRMPAEEFLKTTTIAAAATADVDLRPWAGLFIGYRFGLYGFIPATDDVSLYMRFSTDGGSTFDATGYSHASLRNVEGTSAAVGSGAENHIILASGAASNGVGSGASEGYSGFVTLYRPSVASLQSRVTFGGAFVSANATPATVGFFGAGVRETAQDTDAVRFLFSSGNITSGVVTVTGLRG